MATHDDLLFRETATPSKRRGGPLGSGVPGQVHTRAARGAFALPIRGRYGKIQQGGPGPLAGFKDILCRVQTSRVNYLTWQPIPTRRKDRQGLPVVNGRPSFPRPVPSHFRARKKWFDPPPDRIASEEKFRELRRVILL